MSAQQPDLAEPMEINGAWYHTPRQSFTQWLSTYRPSMTQPNTPPRRTESMGQSRLGPIHITDQMTLDASVSVGDYSDYYFYRPATDEV